MQAPQRHAIEQRQQFLEPLPDGLTFFDEAIYWHYQAAIVDCFRTWYFVLRTSSANLSNLRLGGESRQTRQRTKLKDQSTSIAMLIECVPNFSEGRKGETIASIARAIEAVNAATVLDRHIDTDHNRSVVTLF